MKQQYVFAVSGVKNSGKTTLTARLVFHFKMRGLKVAVIKHDGHDFVPDVPNTDSSRVRRAGADGVAVFSERRTMVIHERRGISEKELLREFPYADIIILEGFKYSDYPKVEVVRRENSSGPVCDPENLLAIVTDFGQEELSDEYRDISLYGLEKIEAACLAKDIYEGLTEAGVLAPLEKIEDSEESLE